MDPGRRTRARLLELTRQLHAMRRGAELLRTKREALLREFLAGMDRVEQGRERIEEGLGRARLSLARAIGVDGRGSVRSAGDAARRHIPLEVVAQHVWGVRFPELHWPPLARSVDGRGYSPSGVSASMDDAARQFEQVLERALESVMVEMRMKKLGSEIRKVSRRVNALQDILLPATMRAMNEIRRALEEREREDLFRLKQLKGRASRNSGASGCVNGRGGGDVRCQREEDAMPSARCPP